MILKLLASPTFFGLGIPIIFLLAGAQAKKTVRGSGGRERADLSTNREQARISSKPCRIFRERMKAV